MLKSFQKRAQMYTFPKPLFVREELLKQGVKIFTPMQFARFFGTTKFQTKYFLEEQAKKGLFERLKKGLYALKTDLPDEEEIANALYRPSYISFEYALAYFGLLPEMPYLITSATTKPTRLFTLSNTGTSFAYYSIKKEAYSGYSLIKSKGKSFLIAEPEKALADYLYFQSLGKKPVNERLVLESVDKKKLLGYIKLYKRKSLNSLIENLL